MTINPLRHVRLADDVYMGNTNYMHVSHRNKLSSLLKSVLDTVKLPTILESIHLKYIIIIIIIFNQQDIIRDTFDTTHNNKLQNI